MLGDAGVGSYLKDSSLHHTFNRCVTIHGTNKLNISGNVCHDHVGHGYFLEDGAEVGNVLEGNLGLMTRRPAQGERLLPSDNLPATFWITNPENSVRDNVAAGSQGNGFWLAFPEHPTGLSTNANIWPRRTPLREFSGNVAHSNGNDSLHMDSGPKPDGNTEMTVYSPRQNQADGSSTPVVAEFDNFAGYKNRQHAAWLRGFNLRLTRTTLADNAVGATFAGGESFLQDSLVVGETANKGTPRSSETKGLDGRSMPRPGDADFPIRGFEFYDGRVGAERTTFANFTPNTQRQASGLSYLWSNGFPIHPRNFVSDLRFVDANRVYLPDPVPGKDGDASSVFLDADGSVTGTANHMVAANNPFLVNSSCSSREEWNAHVCEAEYATLRVGTLDGDPNGVSPLTVRRADGETQILNSCCGTDRISSVLPDQTYEVAFNGDTPQRARFVLTYGREHWVGLRLPYAGSPKVTRSGQALAPVASPSALEESTTSAYFYDAASGTLHLKLNSKSTEYEELRIESA